MAQRQALVTVRPEGLYCPAGDFYIDPWRPVARAVITHAHADHARRGHAAYLAHEHCAPLLRARLGEDLAVQPLRYGEALTIGAVRVSLHPAGHVLGSAQVRLAHRGEVWVVSGDYKLDADGVSAPFEPVRCHTFITESTFGLPIYRWPDPNEELARLLSWWRGHAEAGRVSVVYAYGLGKAQRLLAALARAGSALPGPILVHPAVEPLNAVHRALGVALAPTQPLTAATGRAQAAGALVLAPPAAQGGRALRRLGEQADAHVSGWMLVRGQRRRRGVDAGFVLSDHADWPALLRAIEASGAGCVRVTHGHVMPLVRHLQEQGLEAQPLATAFGGDEAGDDAALPAAAPAPGAAPAQAVEGEPEEAAA
ncbi:putative exonuclease, DNA ligase-associated [Tepidimonas sediminis]|uniref:Putative exonuclease, DNA ligase-associated n=1 Tax=Tepidimonas sediminis TaxID=2588941 RepID=A0A554WL38_9BURK|nr:ligase-associated DNA damage response exonuclease [Tepidimonas sediminis]TSE24310.1 putative exonuclease, DNA ligase-associated [Tepidimonas sediminis]